MSDTTLTKKDHENLARLIAVHNQRSLDYARLGDTGRARLHAGFSRTLEAVQILLRGNELGCAGCMREGGKAPLTCAKCSRSPEREDLYLRHT